LRNDTSFRSPGNKPCKAISNRSRPIALRMPERSNHHAIECESHSDASFAVHGASSGTRFAMRSTFHCANAMVTIAAGLIFGMSPV